MGQKVQPKHTLGIIESILDGSIKLEKLSYPQHTYIYIPDDLKDYDDVQWQLLLREQMRKRALFLSGVSDWNRLPKEAVEVFEP